MVPRVRATVAPAASSFAWRLLVDVGDVLLAWAALIVAELLLVSAIHADLLAGHWEIVEARKLVAPLALAMLVPVAGVAVGAGRLWGRATRNSASRWAMVLAATILFGLVAYGVSFGRHMQAIAVRASFVAGVASLGATLGYLAPPLARKLSPRLVALLASVVAALSWTCDLYVLPRLYPAFHAALFVLLLASVAALTLAFRAEIPSRERRVVSAIALVASLACVAWAPGAARRLERADNLRLVLLERAPLLGRAVKFGAFLAPPAPLDALQVVGAAPLPSEIPRALDWTGHDVLLVSVDALRADHVSAYGYARSTTPNLDALASEGALFERAYCPTPHTSYSVTSMMTGKAMRPLMALGLGAGSETWAAQLRRYGFKTAAFYPPAVFYIDPDRFGAFEASHLDFEYAKVQFSSAEERVGEVARYLDDAGPSPLFLWVHLFEPHEPYVMHPSHPFGEGAPKPVDAYDSEIAYADDALGKLVALVREKRPGVAIVVTADHGEEFGEHGGRYHGTSCYEEQVRVPLVVVGPGISKRRVTTVAQTIDLLPTVLSALGMPRPARVRGRDLGALLAGHGGKSDLGLAYAETDDYSLVARGVDRLVCARRIGACALYDIGSDPAERVDRSRDRPEVAQELRGVLAGLERDQGRYEGGSAPWPDPIRRGLMRELDVAEDAATLLDDASAPIRRKAAEVMFMLHAPLVAPQTRRALQRDEDAEVQKWCALALVRMGETPSTQASALIRDPDVAWRRRAALSFASRGDARGGGELAREWREEAPPHSGLDIEESKERLAALANIRVTEVVPDLLDSLAFVPLRPFIADALGAIADPRARAALLALFTTERYETARSHEADALVALGARRELREPLARFAGLPDPMVDAVRVARMAKLLEPGVGGIALESSAPDLVARVSASSGPLRLLVLSAGEGGELTGSFDGKPLPPQIDASSPTVHVVDLDGGAAGSIEIRLHEPRGILAAWVVSRVSSTGPFDLHAADK
jgi:arylsulfatase A-like enzyme